ncbi:MAG: pyridoxal 5'-phosphate synthase, partial [Alphaproteobacteria bacterium]|nr:pyridoxal 5'-phosphate synthase [Alphaproteobacteria bacterium]
VDAATADAYFRSRPRASQLAAWASDQSQPISDRAHLFDRYAAFDRKFAGIDVPRPPHWLGYRLAPRVIEFWQDVADRMHDRLVYTREGKTWRIGRIAP